MTARADRLMEFLATEGYRPVLHPGGGVDFKHDGGTFLIRFDPSDDEFLAISYPNFWRFTTDAELTRALQAANRATYGIKVVKLIIFEECRQVWATVELFSGGTAQLEATFRRVLSVLKAGVERFEKEMRASEPLDGKRIALTRGEITRFQHGN